MTPQLSYWVANWNLSRAQASRLLGGDVVDVVDCTSSSVERVSRAYPAVKRFAAYITGTGGIEWTAEQLLHVEQLGPDVELLLIDQSPRVNADIRVKRVIKDEEPGASSVETAVETWRLRHQAGEDFVIYVDQADLTRTEDAIARAGLPHGTIRGYQWASDSSNPHTPLPGTHEDLRTANADLSVFERAFFAAPAPPPPPPPRPTDELEHANIRVSVVYDRLTDHWAVARATVERSD